jgi:hypothetical protein
MGTGPFVIRQFSRSIARSTRRASRRRATQRTLATAASTATAPGTNSAIPASPSRAVVPTNPAASHSTSPSRTNAGGSPRASLTPSIVVQLAKAKAKARTRGRRCAVVTKLSSCPRRAGIWRVWAVNLRSVPSGARSQSS